MVADYLPNFKIVDLKTISEIISHNRSDAVKPMVNEFAAIENLAREIIASIYCFHPEIVKSIVQDNLSYQFS